MSDIAKVASVRTTGFVVENSARQHTWTIDEPESNGGTDTAPTPIEALGGALGACTIATLQMYLDRKGWTATHLAVNVDVDWRAVPPTVTRTIDCRGDFDDEQRARLAKIANACPVHKLLSNASTVTTAWSSGS